MSSKELVMRAREQVYHISCFTCDHCKRILATEEYFGIRGMQIYCKADCTSRRNSNLENGAGVIFHERTVKEKENFSPFRGCFGPTRYGLINKKNLSLDSKRKGRIVTLFVHLYVFYFRFMLLSLSLP